MKEDPHVLIVGGGFGGLYAAKRLASRSVKVTLADRRNFHLFQPLLYQVATGGLSPGDIASPLRAVLGKHTNTQIRHSEVEDIDPTTRTVFLNDGRLRYDILILATGTEPHYFGHREWEHLAPGLKSIEDAVSIRSRLFYAFEAAEKEPDPAVRDKWLTFVLIGGGATGVELAGAIGELCHHTLRHDFRNISTDRAQIILVEAGPRVLGVYPPHLSIRAQRSLERLGVTVRTGTLVTEIGSESIRIKAGESEERIDAKTILWTAGVTASPLAGLLAAKTGAELDRMGRIIVRPDLTIPGYDNIYVIGDLAHFSHQTGNPLPGVAQVAMQGGRYVARKILADLQGRPFDKPFHYLDKGNLAVIGRNAAVADFGKFSAWGFPAWFVWIFIHITYLIEFDNKILVLFQWAWDYFTRKRGARLITGAEAPERATASHPKSSVEAR